MSWKEEYKLGDETIDTQHKELFKRVDALVKIVEAKDAALHKQECIDAILFLKNYAVNHFAAEEAFQESKNYRYLEFHKAIHSTFVNNVLEAEQKLVETDFALPVVKEVCGFLCMWLIYHVAGADQKIIRDEPVTVAEFALTVSYEDCVLESLTEVLETVFGDSLDVLQTSKPIKINNAIYIDVQCDDCKSIQLALSENTALKLVNAVTDIELTEVDELAHAVLSQFARSICGNMTSSTGTTDNTDNYNLPIQSYKEGDELFITTRFGYISIRVNASCDAHA